MCCRFTLLEPLTPINRGRRTTHKVPQVFHGGTPPTVGGGDKKNDAIAHVLYYRQKKEEEGLFFCSRWQRQAPTDRRGKPVSDHCVFFEHRRFPEILLFRVVPHHTIPVRIEGGVPQGLFDVLPAVSDSRLVRPEGLGAGGCGLRRNPPGTMTDPPALKSDACTCTAIRGIPDPSHSNRHTAAAVLFGSYTARTMASISVPLDVWYLNRCCMGRVTRLHGWSRFTDRGARTGRATPGHTTPLRRAG